MIYSILRNVTYAGSIRIPAFGREPEEVVPGLHPAIVSKEMFDEVQNILCGHVRNHIRRPCELFPLKGFLTCVKCGRLLTAGVSRGHSGRLYHYYRCHRRCSENFRADKANDTFVELLKASRVSRPYAEAYLLVAKDHFTQLARSNKPGFDGELKKVEERIHSLDMKFIDGEITKETYDRLKSGLDRDRARLAHEKTSARSSFIGFDSYLKDSVTILTDLDNYYTRASIDQKHRILGCIFPEKLKFQNGSFTTPRINQVWSSMLPENSILKNKKPAHQEQVLQKVPLGDPKGI